MARKMHRIWIQLDHQNARPTTSALRWSAPARDQVVQGNVWTVLAHYAAQWIT